MNKNYKMTMREYTVTRNAIIAYAEGIADHLKAIVDLESFASNMRANHNYTTDFLHDELMRLHAAAQKDINVYRQAFYGQYMINTAYKVFYTELGMGINYAEKFIKELLENPDKFIQQYEKDCEKELKPKTVPVEIIGSRIEYIPYHNSWESDQGVTDEDTTQEHYIVTIAINDKNNHRRYYEFNAYTYEDSCYSGWCGADYGCLSVKRVSHPDITAKIKPMYKTFDMDIEFYNILWNDIREYETVDIFRLDKPDMDDTMDFFNIPNVLKVSEDGGDMYYPCGYVDYSEEAFEKPCVRQSDVAKVWIFKGESGTGKTFIGNMLEEDLKTFETDAYKELPDRIVASVIIMGNKYDHTVEDIEQRMKFPHETILVDFSSNGTTINIGE